MDSIRLGYDSKVYHMEQGEPCGDSPPPPPQPLSQQPTPPPPPPPHGTEPSGTKNSVEAPPAWTNRRGDHLAECQGCIAEQRIEHTCTHANPSHHYQHHHHHPSRTLDHEDQFVDVQRKAENTDAHQLSDQKNAQDFELESEIPLAEQKPRLGRNTWPRKKVRQVRHAADIFDGDEDGGDDSGEIMVESGSNYFVSVDDSVCDAGGRLVVEYSLTRTGSVHRIPRNSKNPLPPELETVKKGTPLYGQPSWWGEDADTCEKDTMDPTQKVDSKSPRPSSLVVQSDDSQHQHHQHKDSKAIYMEIPHRAATPERDKPPSSHHRDKVTPARSLTSSLSKDSLVVSPDSARERSVDKDFDPGRANTSEMSSNPALSFTVEFGDEKKPKLKSGASLSQFVPTKLRNSLSLHARSDKSSSKGRDSDGSCKNSEERELSPHTSGRRKSEEPVGSETTSKGKSTRRSSGHGTGVGSLKSADFASETPSVSAKSRKDVEKRTREVERDVDRKPPKTQDLKKPSTRTTSSSTSKSSKTKPQPTAAAIAASVQAAQYSDPTAYLIDRMFAGATETSAGSPRSDFSDRERSDSPTAPEHIMYKEAKDFDRASQQRGGLRGSSKPVQKQKSLSKSPAGNGKSAGGNGKSPAGNGKSLSGAATPKSPVAAAASPRSPASKMAKCRTPEKLSKSLKEKSAEPDVVATPPVLPVAPSPLEDGGGDQEDKVSEAGTYTIEAEEDGEEELIARQQIDEVYGVELSNLSFERPVIDSLEAFRTSEDDEEGETTLLEDEGDSLEPGCQTPCEEGESVFEDEEGMMSRSIGEEEVPSWINQLNALTAASRHTPPTSKEGAARGTDDASKKPPQGGLSRKRPGTGRKLPSIPTASDQSPVSSEHSVRLLDNSPDSPANSMNCTAPARLENGLERSTDDSPSRNTKFSPVVSGSGGVSGSPCGSENSGTNTNNGAKPKGTSVCSRGSIDTELLLRDTETVMAAMEARMGFQNEDREDEEGGESDTDLTSTVAMVNGDEDFVKPTKYHSPRDTMTGKSSKDKDNSNIRIASASSSKKSLTRSYSEQKPPRKGDRSPRSAAGLSVVSDVFSRSDSLDQSFPSDASDGGSDRTDTSFSRSGSRGKGTITMTKPNRAFALRRARADGAEVTDTARSRTTAASSAATPSTRRSSSIHGTSRTACSDRTGTGRSEASLGAQIVKKARENTGGPKARDSSITRQDGAPRSSLRAADRRSSAGSSSASSTISSSKKERDIRTLKSQLKSAPGNKDLAITGTSSSRSQSQPGSRSNSPKAAERMAWKRRKEYDPRKAVAEAKANKAKEPRPKPKVQSSSLYKQRMTRSASFTNSVELSGRVRHDTYNVDSISSVEDLSSAATASDSYGEVGFRRAFIPFHNPLRSDRLSHSADEDEAGTFPTSQSYDSLIVSSIYQLSLKLKTTMDKALIKLREQDRASITPSPIDDFLGHPAKSEIPAWKSANQELAGVLKNLRKMEHHLHLMERALFPDEDTDTDVSGMSSVEKHKYFQEIERIRSELAGFQPIDSPHAQDPGSPELAELSKNTH